MPHLKNAVITAMQENLKCGRQRIKVETHGDYIQAFNLFRMLLHCSELIDYFVGRKPTGIAP
jgi:hypothetical protein